MASDAHDRLISQAILPSSNSVLNLGGAHFTFQWCPPSQEREIKAAKKVFLLREGSESGRRTPLFDEAYELVELELDNEYSKQWNYRPDMSPLALLQLPFQIRYMIFRLLLHKDSITLCTNGKTD